MSLVLLAPHVILLRYEYSSIKHSVIIFLTAFVFHNCELIATTYVFESPKALIEESDLIALVDVGEVHVARTQEGFVIESATANLLAVAWRRYKPEFEDKEGKIELCAEGIEFTALTEPVTKNGREIYESNAGLFQKAISFYDIDSGKAFFCLKRGYLRTYKLLDSPLSFQHVDEKGEISWSTGQSGKFTYTRVQPSIALEEIKVRCVALLANQQTNDEIVGLKSLDSSFVTRRSRDGLVAIKGVIHLYAVS